MERKKKIPTPEELGIPKPAYVFPETVEAEGDFLRKIGKPKFQKKLSSSSILFISLYLIVPAILTLFILVFILLS